MCFQNAFLGLGPRTNVFQALSYDTLHTDDLGQWGKHLWPLLKENIVAAGGNIVETFNSWYVYLPIMYTEILINMSKH